MQNVSSFRLGGAVQVTFGAAGTGAGLDAASPVAVPYPAGIVAGSFLVLHVVADNSISPPATISTPSGWTLIASQVNSGSDRLSKCFYKIADGSESGSLNVTFSSDAAFGRMYRFSHGSGVEAAASAITETSGTGMSAVNVTSTVNLAIAVQLFFANVNTTIGNISGESGGDYTEAAAEFTDASYGLLSCQTAQLATAGAITGGSATLGTNSASRIRHGFVIKP